MLAILDNLRIDDPVGAISVHGICGLFGMLCVGLFADGTYGRGYNGTIDRAGNAVAVRGLLAHGGMGQLEAQLIGMAAVIIWGFGLSYLFFHFCNAVMGIRSRPEDELAGLDIPETGILAYPSFHVGGDDFRV